MKKIYNTPCLELLSVEVRAVLASSSEGSANPNIGIRNDNKMDPEQAWSVETRDWDNIWQ